MKTFKEFLKEVYIDKGYHFQSTRKNLKDEDYLTQFFDTLKSSPKGGLLEKWNDFKLQFPYIKKYSYDNWMKQAQSKGVEHKDILAFQKYAEKVLPHLIYSSRIKDFKNYDVSNLLTMIENDLGYITFLNLNAVSTKKLLFDMDKKLKSSSLEYENEKVKMDEINKQFDRIESIRSKMNWLQN